MRSSPDLVRSTVRAVAGFGLSEGEAPGAPVSEADARPILRGIVDERLTGLALAAEGAGMLRLPAGEQEELERHHANAMLWALALERELVLVTALLEEAGIGSVVLKGPAVAHTVYPDPAWRSFGDLDLLVEASDLARAVELLEAQGFARRLPEPRAGFDTRFGKGVELRNGSKLDVDLHRTLALGPFGVWLDTRTLFEHTEPFTLGGRAFRKLDAEAILVHAAMHATLGSRMPRLVALRDVAQISDGARPDWEAVRGLVDAWQAHVVIDAALRAASSQLGWPIPIEAEGLLGGKASRRERRALSAYSRGSQRSDAMAMGSLRTIKGVGAKAAYARAMLLPSREFLAARANAPAEGSYVRRWLSPLRRLFGQP